MLFNFFKTTFRSFLKNRTFVVINLLGLSLSLACCIVAYLNYDFGVNFDSQHQKLDRIYKIQVQKEADKGMVDYGMSPMALGTSIEGQRSEVSHISRFDQMDLVIKREDILFNELVAFVDDDYFSMFDYTFKYGSPRTLQDKKSIILSEETAEKYFELQNPIGEMLTLIDPQGKTRSYQVGAVLNSIPMNSSMRPSGIMHFDNYLDLNETDNQNWSRFIAATFVEIKDNTFPVEMENWLNNQFIEVQNSARDNWKVDRYYLQDFSSYGTVADNLRSQWLNQPPPKPAIIVPLIMSILMLCIACFNFTNTALATSSKRLKEIGVRKVLGGSRRQLIIQFMGENIVLSVLALLIAISISLYLTPAYDAMWEFIDIKLDLLGNPELYLFLLVLLILTSVIAGIYPSIYVSSFRPVSILRGTLKVGGVSKLSQVLLGGQVSLTILALIASYSFVQNARYQQSLDVGYEKENIMAVRVYNNGQYESLKNRLVADPDYSEVSGTGQHIGAWEYSRSLKHTNGTIDAGMLNITPDYMKLMDLEMVEGRAFIKDTEETDRQSSILVNEVFAQEAGWGKQAVGQYLQMDDSTRLKVVGVMKNFHMWGFWSPIEPMAFRPATEESYNFVVFKVPSGNIAQLKEKVESIWYEIEPNKPASISMQDEYLENTLLVNSNITTMFTFMGILALLLSLIGLYTLVSLSVLKRVKEIGIRKVLGAKVQQIIHLINVPYYWTFAIAAIIGSTLSWFAIDGLMSSIFAYYKSIDTLTLLLPVLVIILIAFMIGGVRILKAAIQNPVLSLRYE